MASIQPPEIPHEYTFHIPCCDKIDIGCLHAGGLLLPDGETHLRLNVTMIAR